jgi:hypothetical protein
MTEFSMYSTGIERGAYMTPRMHSRFVMLVSLLSVIAILSGCAAVHTSIAKKDLDVQTKMSDTVFLDPVGPDKKTVFVQIRNTSVKPFDIEGAIVSAIVAAAPSEVAQ